MNYQIYSDATADTCPSMREGLLTAEIIPMEVMVGDRSYTYGPGGDLTVEPLSLIHIFCAAPFWPDGGKCKVCTKRACPPGRKTASPEGEAAG